MEKPALRMQKLEDLKPYERNARSHSEAQIGQIMASIQEFGWTIPILVDEDNLILAGHARQVAGLRLGIPKAPTLTKKGLTTAQKKAYCIADNRLTENSSWLDDVLAAEMMELQEADFDLSILGFAEKEVQRLLYDEPESDAKADDVPTEAEERCKPGQIWKLGRHLLQCADCTDSKAVEKLFKKAPHAPNLMVTDPPYGVNYDPKWRDEAPLQNWAAARSTGKVLHDDKFDWTPAWRLFPGNVMYVWHAGRFAADVQKTIENAGFDIRAQIIWAKDHLVIGRGNYHWQHEPCWYAIRQGGKANSQADRKQTTIWRLGSMDATGHKEEVDKPSGHGTQKPVEAMMRPMAHNSEQAECVYDPFVGAGTSIIAAEISGRICLAMDIDPHYCDLALQRWENYTNKKARLA